MFFLLLQLQEVPGLSERMASLMCVDIDIESGHEEVEETGTREDVITIMEREVCIAKDKGKGTVSWLELDELGIDDDMLLCLDLPSKFPVCFSIVSMELQKPYICWKHLLYEWF